MDLSSIENVKKLLEKYNAKPSKLMGQNFLVHPKTLQTIIETANITSKDTILEVGPGIGTLTQELATRAGRVVAIEKDAMMVKILQETLKDRKNIEVIQENILKFDPKKYQLKDGEYHVVANIPYYLTSHLIRKFLEEKERPESIILMIQKEVAQRICASVPNMSLLAVSVQFYATVEVISYVSKSHFWPAPNVDSAIIKITPFERKNNVDVELFFKIVKAGFSQPRKQLANNLSKGLKKDKQEIEVWLSKNSINSKRRAETLSVEDWISLTKSF